MENKILINGIIGVDVKIKDISNMLNSINGDVEITINSPGGDVYEGIAIFNAIKNYKKGKTYIIVSGLAASMGSYIMLAGDTLSIEETAVVMIHNPYGVVKGDYREYEKAKILNTKLRNIMSSIYSKHSKKSISEIEKMMDEETWFSGKEELSIWGNVIESKNPQNDRNTAEIQVKAMLPMLSEDNNEKLIALLDMNVSSKADNIINNQKIKMDLKTLKEQYPEVYAQAVDEGINKEKNRVSAHLEFMDVSPNLALENIKNNISFLNNESVQSQYLKAQIGKQQIKEMENESPDPLVQAQINEKEKLDSNIDLETEKKIMAHMKQFNNKE